MVKDVKLISKEIVEEDRLLYLSLKYQYEEKDGTHVLHIPRVALNILTDRLPECTTESSPYDIDPDCYILVPHHRFELNKGPVVATNKFGEIVNIPRTNWVDCLIRENQIEMTIEEIEKKLGHKIKIVGKSKK